MPHVIVIAGPNGAGKSTTAPSILKETLGVTEFVNADTIAQGLSAFNPEGFFSISSPGTPVLIATYGQDAGFVKEDEPTWECVAGGMP